jgi:predicted nuclease of predicted toxin-antitoxin system
MKFLADQDVYGVTIRFLIDAGHDVVPVAQLGLAHAEDAELLRVAHQQGRIFITRDATSALSYSCRGAGPASYTFASCLRPGT